MNSSLHPLAASEELDLGAFLYATRRLPDEVADAKVIVMGQEAIVFKAQRHRPDRGLGAARGARAPAPLVPRRRRHARGAARLRLRPRRPHPHARRLPDRVEQAAREAARRRTPRRRPVARRSAPRRSAARRRIGRACATPGARASPSACATSRERRLNLRVRMLGGSAVGYARMTRRWWRPVRATLAEQGLDDRPIYFVSSNAHSIVNLLTGTAREREAEIIEWVDALRRPRPQARARPLPLRRGRGLVGELPLLRRARVLHRAARGLRHLRAALARGARGRRHAPLEHDRAARLGAGDRPRPARPARARPAARRHRRARASPPATR